jgi:hypothetical protein
LTLNDADAAVSAPFTARRPEGFRSHPNSVSDLRSERGSGIVGQGPGHPPRRPPGRQRRLNSRALHRPRPVADAISFPRFGGTGAAARGPQAREPPFLGLPLPPCACPSVCPYDGTGSGRVPFPIGQLGVTSTAHVRGFVPSVARGRVIGVAAQPLRDREEGIERDLRRRSRILQRRPSRSTSPRP